MVSRARKCLLALLSAAVLLNAGLVPTASASILGKKCTTVGSTKTAAKVKYICSKSGNSKIWIKASRKAKSTGTLICPSVNPEADALRALAKREVQNLSLPDFVTLEIEPGALNPQEERQFTAAIAAATRAADPTVPVQYYIPKTKNWLVERWPKEDDSYLRQVTTDRNVPFPAHSLGDKTRYAVAGVSLGESRLIEFVQVVSIVLKPANLRGSTFHWYGHSFGGPYGAAISEALGIGCYSEFRSHAVKMAKDIGADLRANISWDAPQSGWYQGFLANEYLTGSLGLFAAGKLIPDSLDESGIDANFRRELNLDLKGFYAFMADRLTKEFAK